jgi:glycosyltransferase involved in cell wall biosynthesis
MSYFPNADAVTYFAEKVLPLIRRDVPEARFLIVGRNPGPKVRELAGMAGVEVTGFVPDIREQLGRMHVAVAPFSIAAGIQNKILEAMAFGIPVVCTSRAAQGLLPEAAAAVNVTDEAEEMAAVIVQLLRDPDLARKKGLEGRRRVSAEYPWERSLGRLMSLVENPADRQPAATASMDRA